MELTTLIVELLFFHLPSLMVASWQLLRLIFININKDILLVKNTGYGLLYFLSSYLIFENLYWVTQYKYDLAILAPSFSILQIYQFFIFC